MNLYRNTNWCKPLTLILIVMLAGLVSFDRPATMVLIHTDLGDISVESNLCKGSIFTVMLPLDQKYQLLKKILIIEDEESIRKIGRAHV